MDLQLAMENRNLNATGGYTTTLTIRNDAKTWSYTVRVELWDYMKRAQITRADEVRKAMKEEGGCGGLVFGSIVFLSVH